MAALTARLSTSTRPSTTCWHSLKVSCPTCTRVAALHSSLHQKPAAWDVRKVKDTAGKRHCLRRDDLPIFTLGVDNSLKAACPTCLTATPSAKASTFDRVTRRPRTRDTAIAFAPAAGFRAAVGKLVKCLEPEQAELAEEQGQQAGAEQGQQAGVEQVRGQACSRWWR